MPKEIWLDLVNDPEKPNDGKSRGSVHLCLTFRKYETESDVENSPVHKLKPPRGRDGIPYDVYRREYIPLGSSAGVQADSVKRKKSGKAKSVLGKVFGSGCHEAKPVDVLRDYGITGEAEYIQGGSIGAERVQPSGGKGF